MKDANTPHTEESRYFVQLGRFLAHKCAGETDLARRNQFLSMSEVSLDHAVIFDRLTTLRNTNAITQDLSSGQFQVLANQYVTTTERMGGFVASLIAFIVFSKEKRVENQDILNAGLLDLFFVRSEAPESDSIPERAGIALNEFDNETGIPVLLAEHHLQHHYLSPTAFMQ